MDQWIIFAIVSPLFYAVTNVLDKFILSKRIKDVYSFGGMLGICYLIISSIIIHITGMPNLGKYLFPIILLGCVSGAIHLLFFRVMRKSEISRVIGMTYAYPVFVALFSVVILNEQIELYKYLGVILAVFGAVMLATKKDHLKWKTTPALGLIIFIAVMLSLIDISDKHILKTIKPLEFYPIYLGVAGLIMILPFAMNKTRRTAINSVQYKPYVVLISIASLCGTMSFLTAVEKGPITIVSSIATLQPLFVFILTLLISIWMPSVLKETLKRDAVIHKLFGILFIIAGVLVLVV